MDLILSFPDTSQSFCNGVEFGRLLEKMQRGDENIANCGFPVRIENKEVIISACKEYGYIPVFGSEYFNEWVDFLGIKKSTSNN